jgi:hypothetical protein
VGVLLAKKLKDFLVPGEATDLVLGKDQLSVHDDVKDAVLALD